MEGKCKINRFLRGYEGHFSSKHLHMRHQNMQMKGLIATPTCACPRWLFTSIHEAHNKVKRENPLLPEINDNFVILLWSIFLFSSKDNCWTMNSLFLGGRGRERERDSQLYIIIKRSLIKSPSFCHFKERTKFIDYNRKLKQFVNSANI